MAPRFPQRVKTPSRTHAVALCLVLFSLEQEKDREIQMKESLPRRSRRPLLLFFAGTRPAPQTKDPNLRAVLRALEPKHPRVVVLQSPSDEGAARAKELVRSIHQWRRTGARHGGAMKPERMGPYRLLRDPGDRLAMRMEAERFFKDPRNTNRDGDAIYICLERGHPSAWTSWLDVSEEQAFATVAVYLDGDGRVREREVASLASAGARLGRLRDLARFPGASSILLTGETGVGKSYRAEWMHKESSEALHREGRFVPVNCAGLSDDLLEAELFGAVKNAGSNFAPRAGKFKEAHGGTLFLDEVGELRPHLQARLLLAVQPLREKGLTIRAVQPVGAKDVTHVDVRLIVATNRNLLEDVAQGRFRLDLYARLAPFSVELPPLTQTPHRIIGGFLDELERVRGPIKLVHGRDLKMSGGAVGFLVRLALQDEHPWTWGRRDVQFLADHVGASVWTRASLIRQEEQRRKAEEKLGTQTSAKPGAVGSERAAPRQQKSEVRLAEQRDPEIYVEATDIEQALALLQQRWRAVGARRSTQDLYDVGAMLKPGVTLSLPERVELWWLLRAHEARTRNVDRWAFLVDEGVYPADRGTDRSSDAFQQRWRKVQKYLREPES